MAERLTRFFVILSPGSGDGGGYLTIFDIAFFQIGKSIKILRIDR